MTDPSDRATQVEEENLQAALEDAQRRAKRDQLPRADGTFEFLDCDDCGEEIGEKRLQVAIKNRLCVYCAAARERRR